MQATFPSRTDYEIVIKNLDKFADSAAIKAGKVIMRKDGLFPQAFSGGRAVVFPVLMGTRKYALKCWIQSLGSLEERYQAVSELIQRSKPPYLIESVYRENELLFNGTRYPVLQMQWCDSRTLKDWITLYINDSSRLRSLADRFLEIVCDMHTINMSHGDLQHENILISDDSLITLVDYDSIYLDGLDHLSDEVKGLPGFQHRSRTSQLNANPKSDYLSEYVIYITLVALSKKPELWKQVKDHNRLLFSQEDLLNPSSSNLFRELRGIDGISALIDSFESQCLCSDLNHIKPIESNVGFSRSSPPPRIETDASEKSQPSVNSNGDHKSAASELRKAQTWTSNKTSSPEWIFGKSAQDASTKSNLDNERTSSSQSQDTSFSKTATSTTKDLIDQAEGRSSGAHLGNDTNDRRINSTSVPWPHVNTTNHKVKGRFSGQDYEAQNLCTISFETLQIRLSCISDNGTKNELLIKRKKVIGWRRIGSKVELVTSSLYGGADVLTISPLSMSDTDTLDKIVDHLQNYGAPVAWSDGSPSSARDSDPSGMKPTNLGNGSPASRTTHTKIPETDWKFTSNRPFSYATVEDISYWTGLEVHVVRCMADSIKAKPPFSLIEADRITGRLTGDFSIHRAFEKMRSSRISSPQKSSENRRDDESHYARYGVDLSGVPNSEGEPQASKTPDLSDDNSTLISTTKSSDSTSNSDCFIATAIYGTDSHPELSILRSYRDTVLLQTRLGRHFVGFYYRVGPAIARLVVKSGLSPYLKPLMSIVVSQLPSGK